MGKKFLEALEEKKSILSGISLVALLGVLATALFFQGSLAHVLILNQRKQAGLVPKAVDLSGLRISYLEGGSGPPLVLIHGSGDDKDIWLPMSRYLTPYYRVVAPDLPGFGESDRPVDRSYTAREQAENLERFIQRLGLKSFYLGGHSLGGKIAAAYASQYPFRVKNLWLLAPAGVYSARPSEMYRLLAQGKRVPIFGRTVIEYDRLRFFTMQKPPPLPLPVKEYLIERARRDFPLHNRIYQEVVREGLSLESLSDKLVMPTRIVWGKKDRILDHSGALVLEQMLPRASALLLEEVGHVPMLEEPEKVAADYLHFNGRP